MGVSGQTLNRIWTKARASTNWLELGIHDLRHSGRGGSRTNVFPGSEPVRTPERPNRLAHLRPASSGGSDRAPGRRSKVLVRDGAVGDPHSRSVATVRKREIGAAGNVTRQFTRCTSGGCRCDVEATAARRPVAREGDAAG